MAEKFPCLPVLSTDKYKLNYTKAKNIHDIRRLHHPLISEHLWKEASVQYKAFVERERGPKDIHFHPFEVKNDSKLSQSIQDGLVESKSVLFKPPPFPNSIPSSEPLNSNLLPLEPLESFIPLIEAPATPDQGTRASSALKELSKPNFMALEYFEVDPFPFITEDHRETFLSLFEVPPFPSIDGFYDSASLFGDVVAEDSIQKYSSELMAESQLCNEVVDFVLHGEKGIERMGDDNNNIPIANGCNVNEGTVEDTSKSSSSSPNKVHSKREGNVATLSQKLQKNRQLKLKHQLPEDKNKFIANNFVTPQAPITFKVPITVEAIDVSNTESSDNTSNKVPTADRIDGISTSGSDILNITQETSPDTASKAIETPKEHNTFKIPTSVENNGSSNSNLEALANTSNTTSEPSSIIPCMPKEDSILTPKEPIIHQTPSCVETNEVSNSRKTNRLDTFQGPSTPISSINIENNTLTLGEEPSIKTKVPIIVQANDLSISNNEAFANALDDTQGSSIKAAYNPIPDHESIREEEDTMPKSLQEGSTSSHQFLCHESTLQKNNAPGFSKSPNEGSVCSSLHTDFFKTRPRDKVATKECISLTLPQEADIVKDTSAYANAISVEKRRQKEIGFANGASHSMNQSAEEATSHEPKEPIYEVTLLDKPLELETIDIPTSSNGRNDKDSRNDEEVSMSLSLYSNSMAKDMTLNGFPRQDFTKGNEVPAYIESSALSLGSTIVKKVPFNQLKDPYDENEVHIIEPLTANTEMRITKYSNSSTDESLGESSAANNISKCNSESSSMGTTDVVTVSNTSIAFPRKYSSNDIFGSSALNLEESASKLFLSSSVVSKHGSEEGKSISMNKSNLSTLTSKECLMESSKPGLYKEKDKSLLENSSPQLKIPSTKESTLAFELSGSTPKEPVPSIPKSLSKDLIVPNLSTPLELQESHREKEISILRALAHQLNTSDAKVSSSVVRVNGNIIKPPTRDLNTPNAPINPHKELLKGPSMPETKEIPYNVEKSTINQGSLSGPFKTTSSYFQGRKLNPLNLSEDRVDLALNEASHNMIRNKNGTSFFDSSQEDKGKDNPLPEPSFATSFKDTSIEPTETSSGGDSWTDALRNPFPSSFEEEDSELRNVSILHHPSPRQMELPFETKKSAGPFLSELQMRSKQFNASMGENYVDVSPKRHNIHNGLTKYESHHHPRSFLSSGYFTQEVNNMFSQKDGRSNIHTKDNASLLHPKIHDISKSDRDNVKHQLQPKDPWMIYPQKMPLRETPSNNNTLLNDTYSQSNERFFDSQSSMREDKFGIFSLNDISHVTMQRKVLHNENTPPTPKSSSRYFTPSKRHTSDVSPYFTPKKKKLGTSTAPKESLARQRVQMELSFSSQQGYQSSSAAPIPPIYSLEYKNSSHQNKKSSTSLAPKESLARQRIQMEPSFSSQQGYQSSSAAAIHSIHPLEDKASSHKNKKSSTSLAPKESLARQRIQMEPSFSSQQGYQSSSAAAIPPTHPLEDNSSVKGYFSQKHSSSTKTFLDEDSSFFPPPAHKEMEIPMVPKRKIKRTKVVLPTINF